jgi:hypothetical protein
MDCVEAPTFNPFKISITSSGITSRRHSPSSRSRRATVTFTNHSWVVIREYIPKAWRYFVELKVSTVVTRD